MISIFGFQDYRQFMRRQMLDRPKKGRGQSRKLAEFLKVHTTFVSQVFHGAKDLSHDQAALAAEFLELNEFETEYFVLLVQLNRAGNQSARKLLSRQLSQIREKASLVKSRLKVDGHLSEEHRATYYSDWAFSAVRQFTAIAEFATIDAIADHLNLQHKRVRGIMEFLLATGLCKETKGKFSVGPAGIYLEASSPWVRVHHSNWRDQAIRSLDGENPNNLHYTSPMTLAKRDAHVIRERLLKLIEEINLIVDPSPSENFHCLNIDWFSI